MNIMLGRVGRSLVMLSMLVFSSGCNNATLSLGVGTSFGGYGGYGSSGFGHVSIGTTIPLGR